MSTNTKGAVARSLAAAGLVAGALAFLSTAASAGQCPADKMAKDAMKPAAEANKPVGVTDTVLNTIDLSKEIMGLDNRQLRIRQLTVAPGGVVPWHSHKDRPALIYIVKGEISEYASNCSVPIVHKAGETSRDADLSHWWKNHGTTEVVLISTDVFNTKP